MVAVKSAKQVPRPFQFVERELIKYPHCLLFPFVLVGFVLRGIRGRLVA
jgi:hypothetical protein